MCLLCIPPHAQRTCGYNSMWLHTAKDEQLFSHWRPIRSCICVWENCSSHHIRRTKISIFILFLWEVSFLFCFNMLNIIFYLFYFSFVNYFALFSLFNLLRIYFIHLLTCSLLRNCIAGLQLNGVTSVDWI